jgi:hypothetical protein
MSESIQGNTLKIYKRPSNPFDNEIMINSVTQLQVTQNPSLVKKVNKFSMS